MSSIQRRKALYPIRNENTVIPKMKIYFVDVLVDIKDFSNHKELTFFIGAEIAGGIYIVKKIPKLIKVWVLLHEFLHFIDDIYLRRKNKNLDALLDRFWSKYEYLMEMTVTNATEKYSYWAIEDWGPDLMKFPHTGECWFIEELGFE